MNQNYNSSESEIDTPLIMINDVRRKREEFSTEIRNINRMNLIKKRRVWNPSETNTALEKTFQILEVINETDKKENEKNKSNEEELIKQAEFCLQKDFTLKDLPTIVHLITSSDERKQIAGVMGLRKILSIDKPPIQEVIETKGVVEILIEFLKPTKFFQLQLESAWCITNLVSGNTEQTSRIISAGAVPKLINLLNSSKSEEIMEQAIWGIGNIAGDTSLMRDLIINENGVKYLVKLIPESKSVNIKKQGAWALSNLCRGKPLPNYDNMMDCVPIFSALIKEFLDDENVINDCIWALNYFSDGDDNRIQKLLDCDIVGTLIQLLNTENYKIINPVLRTIGNILSGNDDQANEILKYNPIQTFINLLNSDKRSVRKEVTWILSNIVASEKNNLVDIVLDNQICLDRLFYLFQIDGNEVKKEILFIFLNMTSRSNQTQILKMIDKKIFSTVLDYLDCMDKVNNVLVILDIISQIIKAKSKIDLKNQDFLIDHLVKNKIYARLENIMKKDLKKKLTERASTIMNLLDDYINGEMD